MSSIDKAVQVIRAHDADGACNEPECLAQDLADAGLLAPDLPAPDQQGRWKVAAASFGSVATSPAGEVVLESGNFRDMQLYLTPGKALDLAYALLAAAQCAEMRASMATPTACVHRLHAHPLPKSYLAAHTEAERRLSNGWHTKKCPECGLYGWEKP